MVQAPITTQPPGAAPAAAAAAAAAASGSVSSYTRVLSHASNSVSVYRGDGGSVAITAVNAAANAAAANVAAAAAAGPPAAHASNLHPAPATQPVVTQPPSNLTPEAIGKEKDRVIFTSVNILAHLLYNICQFMWFTVTVIIRPG